MPAFFSNSINSIKKVAQMDTLLILYQHFYNLCDLIYYVFTAANAASDINGVKLQ